MNRCTPPLLASLGFLLPAASAASSIAAPGADSIYLAAHETDALAAKEGQKVIVHGRAKGSTKSSSGTNFVNFAGAQFYLVTFASDLDRFEEGEPHQLYEGKRLAVEGVISLYRDEPQIKLASPEQVSILEEDETFPPPRPAAPEPAAKQEEAPAKGKDEETGDEDAPEKEKRQPPVDPSEYFD